MNRVDYLDFFGEKEKACLKATQKHLKQEIGLFKISFSLLARTLEKIFPEKGRGKSLIDLALFLLAHHFLMTIKVKCDLIMKGYYYEALVLYRNILETLLLCGYIVQDEKRASQWLKGKTTLKCVTSELDLGSDYRAIWRYLCDYVHVNVPSMSSFVKVKLEEEMRSIRAHYVPRFNKDYAGYLLPTVEPLLTFILADRYSDRLGSKLKNEISKFRKEIDGEWKRYLDLDQNS